MLSGPHTFMRCVRPVSGIMVDGNVGEAVVVDNEPFFHGVLQNADIICLVPGEHDYKGAREVFGVFGNSTIVKSSVPQTLIKQFVEENKDKLVLVKQKPYIINGELNTSFLGI